MAPQIAPPILRKVNWIQSAKEDRRHREITREILTFIPLKLRDVPARNLLDPTSFYSIDRARIKLERYFFLLLDGVSNQLDDYTLRVFEIQSLEQIKECHGKFLYSID